MGYREDYERARLVHILDFGLSRSYAIQSKDGKWVARRARGTAEFRGTLRYCSPNVHEKKEQGRRDDLWSLYYVFIELHCGLPWQTLRDKQKVELLKMHMSDKDLVLNFPVELHGIVPYLRTLDYYQRPDYSMFYEGLLAVMRRVGAKASDPYDWEDPDIVRNIQKHLKGPYAWENAADFFKSDPVKVNCAPPPKPSRKRKYESKVVIEQSGRRDLSDHTTASTDIDKKEVTSELTMTDVDRRLAAFGVVRKPQSLDRLKEQIARKKAVEASKTPDLKDRDMRRIQSEELKEQIHKERSRDDKMGLKKDRKPDTTEDLVKEKDEGKKSKEKEEKRRTIDGREEIEKGTANVRVGDSKQIPSGSMEKIEEDAKVKKEGKEEGKKTTGSKERVEEKSKPGEKNEWKGNNDSKAKTDQEEVKRKQEEELKTFVGSEEEKCKERGGKTKLSGSDEKAEDVQRLKARKERKISTGSAKKLEKDEETRDQKQKTSDTNDKAEKGANPTRKEKGVEVTNIKEKESNEQKLKDARGSKKLEEEINAKETHVNKKLECHNEEKGVAIKAKSRESADNKKKSREDAAHKEGQSKQASGSVIHSTATSTLTLK
ncbi:hypothetical protein Aduo_003762 [Ancylostoma duodenale]